MVLLVLVGCSVEPTDADTARMDGAIEDVTAAAEQLGGTLRNDTRTAINTAPLSGFRQDAALLSHVFFSTEEPAVLEAQLETALGADPPDVTQWNVFDSDGDVVVSLRVLITQ